MTEWLGAAGGAALADYRWLGEIASLLLLPFAHEDLAIVLGAYIIVNDLMPATIVAAAIYGGMVASDFALYGIGAGARRIQWLHRYAVDDRIRAFGDTLKRNLFGLVAVCRIVPGVVFVAFVACGWARVPLGRFTIATLVVSAFYLPLTLYLVIVFGNAIDDYVGLWTWPLLALALIAGGLARKRVFRFAAPGERVQADDIGPGTLVSHATSGLPTMPFCPRKVARAERIPPMLFYAPLVLSWIGHGVRYRSLTLPSVANPAIPTGGMWGESKSDYLLGVAPEQRRWIADFVVCRRGMGDWALRADVECALRRLDEAGIAFPVVAKPDIGWQGYGVRRIASAAALRAYLARFPQGEEVILQRFVPQPAEAAVLYARLPGEEAGQIVSLAYRMFPHVIGDGVSTLRELVEADPRARWKSRLHLGDDPTHRGIDREQLARVPATGEIVQIALIGNQRAGGLYRDGNAHITLAMSRTFDAIARSMPEFHYGRFDIRFDTAGALMRGESFSILEINGIGGEAIDVWDPALPVGEVYRRLFRQQRLIFAIGAGNRARGFMPDRPADFLGHLIRQTRLIRRYPVSA